MNHSATSKADGAVETPHAAQTYFYAEMDAAGFTFRAIEGTESAAKRSIFNGWHAHVVQYRMGTNFDSIEELEDQFSINVLEMTLGAVYRDYSQITPAP